MCREKKRSKQTKLTSSIEISLTNYKSVRKRAPRILHAAENDETGKAVLSWMMPLNFSQSQLGDRGTPSNACTMIAIHFADLCHRFNITLPYRDKDNNWVLVHSLKESLPNDEIRARNDYLCLPEDLLRMFTNGIINGNITHESAIKNREIARVAAAEAFKDRDKNLFTIPKAIVEIQHSYHSQIHEIDYVSHEGSFKQYFPRIIRAAIKSPDLAHMSRLYFIVIAVKRAVFIAFQRETNTIALFDSHSHQKESVCGGAIACVSANQLSKLARWMMKWIYPELLKKLEKLFEVSCVQVLGPDQKNDAPNVVYWEKVETRVFRQQGETPCFPARNDGLQSKQKERRLNERKKRAFELMRTDSGSSDEGTDSEDVMAEYNSFGEFDDEDDMEEVDRWDARLVDNESEKEQNATLNTENDKSRITARPTPPALATRPLAVPTRRRKY